MRRWEDALPFFRVAVWLATGDLRPLISLGNTTHRAFWHLRLAPLRRPKAPAAALD